MGGRLAGLDGGGFGFDCKRGAPFEAPQLFRVQTGIPVQCKLRGHVLVAFPLIP